MAKVKLIELLARRKELQEKVDQLRNVKDRDLTETVSNVKNIQQNSVEKIVAEVVARVPKVSTNQLTHAFDWHAKQLRKVDVAIQQANHTTDVEVDGEVMKDYIDPYHKEEKE